MKNTNIEKRLEAKGDGSAREELIKLASDYSDPNEAIIDLLPELKESLRRQYNAMVEEGYTGTFLDYIKSEIDLKNRTGLSGGGKANGHNKMSKQAFNKLSFRDRVEKLFGVSLKGDETISEIQIKLKGLSPILDLE
tara:strand:+ start:631 stop:1041 length:411 start_codon:yes stop_codon:yes gene_type:complete